MSTDSTWPPRHLEGMSDGEVLAICTSVAFKHQPQWRTDNGVCSYASAYITGYSVSTLTEALTLTDASAEKESGDYQDASRWAAEALKYALRQLDEAETGESLAQELERAIAQDLRFPGPDHREFGE